MKHMVTKYPQHCEKPKNTRSSVMSSSSDDTSEWYVGDSVSGYSYRGVDAALSAARHLMDIGCDEIIIQRAVE